MNLLLTSVLLGAMFPPEATEAVGMWEHLPPLPAAVINWPAWVAVPHTHSKIGAEISYMITDQSKAVIVGGAIVMPAKVEGEPAPQAPLPKLPVPTYGHESVRSIPLPPDVLKMKDHLIARSFYKAQVSVQYTKEDHKKYEATLDAASVRDIKNWHFASTMRSQQAARGHALSQQANMMRIQQIRAQEVRNRLPYKRAATHQPFRPPVIRNPYRPRMHYWVIIR